MKVPKYLFIFLLFIFLNIFYLEDAKKVIIWTEENFINRLDKDSRQKLIENFNSEIKSYLDHFDIEEDFFNDDERSIILDFILSEGIDLQNFHRLSDWLKPTFLLVKYFVNLNKQFRKFIQKMN